MRTFIRGISAALVFAASTAASSLASAEHSRFIEPDTIESAEIVKRGSDVTKRLGAREIIILLTAWNKAKAVGLCKFAFEYKVRLQLKSGRTIKFRTNGQSIKAEDDHCFNVAQKNLFGQIWTSSKKQ